MLTDESKLMVGTTVKKEVGRENDFDLLIFTNFKKKNVFREIEFFDDTYILINMNNRQQDNLMKVYTVVQINTS